MCGITGYWGPSGKSDAVLNEIARVMANALRARGPDDGGTWADASAGIALGHRRLAILELSLAGHQPMVSHSGRYVVAFNGEIYNHTSLRRDLDRQSSKDFAVNDGVGWRGHSDTETLLEGFERWGVDQTLERCVGMFAIALWDRQDRILTLARDRFGEKPLYYGWANGTFLFGSELKALKAYPGFDSPISRKALSMYLRFSYVPAPLSIFEGVYKLEPGCILTVDGKGSVTTRRWWSFAGVVASTQEALVLDEGAAVSELESRLVEAVGLQSRADVPLGAFLSGGLDSSAIVALMQQQTSRPVKTFTVGFKEGSFDEAPQALAVARHLGTEHHEMQVTARMAQEVIPHLSSIYDEPFADSSQIATYLVCRAARQQVKVAVSGDAGDELFGGYNRYIWGPKIWDRFSRLPFPLRKLLGKAIYALPYGSLNALSGLTNVSRLGEKAYKLASRLDAVRDIDNLYWSLVSEWPKPTTILQEGHGLDDFFSPRDPPAGLDPILRMMFYDTVTYLPGDILCKVDRAAMANGLETRVPFLDHRVVELAWRMPLSMKIRGNTGKWALRQILYKYVPRELIERPKTGFAVPIGEWLRYPLREWAETLLDAGRLQREGYLNPQPIRATWEQHLSGNYNWTSRLWSILMFQAWLEDNG